MQKLIRTDSKKEFLCEIHQEKATVVGDYYLLEYPYQVGYYVGKYSIVCDQCFRHSCYELENQCEIEKAIKEIETKLKRSLDIRDKIIKEKLKALEEFTTNLQQLEAQVEKIFQQIYAQIEDWNQQLLILENETFHYSMEEELMKYSTKYSCNHHNSYIEEKVPQINNNFSQLIEKSIQQLTQPIENQIQSLIKQLTEERQNFPQEVEFAQRLAGKSIKSVQFNHNSTLLFVGSFELLYIFDLQNEYQSEKQIIDCKEDVYFNYIVASKKKDMFIASFDKKFQLWYKNEHLIWKNFPILDIHSNKIKFLGLNEKENQIITASFSSNQTKIAIVEINDQIQQLIVVQYIPSLENLPWIIMNPTQTKILVGGKFKFSVWKQHGDEWIFEEEFNVSKSVPDHSVSFRNAQFTLDDQIFLLSQINADNECTTTVFYKKKDRINHYQQLSTSRGDHVFYPKICNTSKKFYLQIIDDSVLVIDQKEIKIWDSKIFTPEHDLANLSYDGTKIAFLDKNERSIVIYKFIYQ